MRSLLTVRGAVLALMGAAVLAFLFYYIVGFPRNVPLAVGSAVFLAELIEVGLDGRRTTPALIMRTLFDGLLAALASWLGVLLVRLFGWMG